MVVPCIPICEGGIGSGITNEFVKCLCKTLKTHSLNLLYHKKNIRKLGEKFAPLCAARQDVIRSVEEAEKKVRVITAEVSMWLDDVSKLEKEIIEMETQVAEMDDGVAAAAKKGCFKGSITVPRYWRRRYQIGKKAAKRLDNVSSLLERAKPFSNFESVSRQGPPPSIESIPVDDFFDFQSPKKAAEGVMAALNDVEIHLIGIYGMGGVGKTTLMMQIGRRVKAAGAFGTIIMVVVSQNPSIDEVRQNIADKLGMENIGTGEDAAAMLAARLRQEKNVLIMLDDIWERLDLTKVGIPYGRDVQQDRVCKVLLTSRKSEVCHAMAVHALVPVDVLSAEDSWSLFERSAGGVVQSPVVEPVAKMVAGECGGLPLALVAVGRALRRYDGRQEWEDALSQLKRNTPTDLEGVQELLFKSLELSYQHLKDPRVKMLFLYCCLFREDHDISEDELTLFVVGELGVDHQIGEVHESLQEVRTSVRIRVNKLKASCLVQEGGKMGCIKLHDVVRDVAVYIASRDEKFLVKAGLGMREWPELGGNMENYIKISFSNNYIEEVQQPPNCPRLVTLLLNINPPLKGLPADFFDAMTALRVLDLSETGIESLPSSITRLTNLTSLCLNRCLSLMDVSLVGQLKMLRMLRLQKCRAKTLPEEIGNLVNLRRLDLSHSVSLTIPRNLLPKLSRLEELYMVGCKRADGDLLMEILSLGSLSRLELFVDDEGLFSNVIRINSASERLTHFFIYNVQHWSSLRSVYRQNLYLKGVGQLRRWPKCLLSRTEDLQLSSCELDVIDLASLDESNGFENLKKLDLAKCDGVQYLLKVNASEQDPGSSAYCNLELLRLMYMESFVGICSGMPPASSFTNLRRIHIERCPKVHEPVPEHLLRRVNRKLQDLSVIGLDEPENILCFDNVQQQDHPVLPSLKALKLQGLPKLVSIWCGVCPPGSLQNLSTLDLHSCNSLEHLFWQESGSTHSYILPPQTFKCLKVLRVLRCGRLKYLFTPRIVNELRSLEVLHLQGNDAMEEIITVEDNVLVEEGAFPALKDLSLVNLPNLNGFYQLGEPRISFRLTSLRSIKMGGCPKLQRLPFGAAESVPHQRINVHLAGQAEAEWFGNLQWTDPRILSRFTFNEQRGAPSSEFRSTQVINNELLRKIDRMKVAKLAENEVRINRNKMKLFYQISFIIIVLLSVLAMFIWRGFSISELTNFLIRYGQ